MGQTTRRPLALLHDELIDGVLLGTCDWGDCDRDQAGWAYSGRGDWLPICAECATGNIRDPECHPVTRFVSFDEVAAVH